MQYDILCPYHQRQERIELPDSYGEFFEGQIPCGDPDTAERTTLEIKITRSSVVGLRKA